MRGELTSIDAIAVGGTPPYFYNWTNNDTTFQSIIELEHFIVIYWILGL